MCYYWWMETINASYFKTHFGEVLGRVRRQPVRITRRGDEPSVLLTESEYARLKKLAARPSSSESEALGRLQRLSNRKPDLEKLAGDLRASAILAKHAPGTDSR